MSIPIGDKYSDAGTGGRFDVFLSYNSADRHAVGLLAEWLKDQGIEPWWDQWCLAPGGFWQDEILEGLRDSKACAVIVGPGGLGPWAREELAVAHNRAVRDSGFRLFMVLLPGAPVPSDPRLAFLGNRTWVDLRAGVDDPDDLQDLLSAIRGVPRRVTSTIATAGICPYKGLEAFEEEDSHVFFGRERDVALVVDKLRASRFLAVLGPSGSGKSSLLRAGIVPALRGGAVEGSDRWAIAVLTPGPRPLAALAVQMTRLMPDAAMETTLDQLSEDERSLDLAMSSALQTRPEQNVVFVVDQFEELFTLCDDENERAAFIANLLYAATIPGGVVLVVMGMRADFYHRCAEYPDLRSHVANEQFLVGPLDTEGLRRAVAEPARRAGLELEAGLVDTLLADVADRPGTLPLVQHVLVELWHRRQGTMLTLESYVAVGGVQAALARRADALYDNLGLAGQQIARRVLLRLVQPGEAGGATRRRVEMEELVPSETERPDVEVVVRVLADHRLLTLGRDDVSGALVVDLAHEALIGGWPALRRWINERRDELRAQRYLTEAAAEWNRGGQRDEDLFGGARLAYWKEHDLGDLTELERTFVERSRQAEDRDRTARRRRVRFTVGGVLVAITAVAAVALVGLRQVSRQREIASSQRDVARSQHLVDQASAEATNDPQLASLLSLAALRFHDSIETRGSVLSRVVQTRGVKQYLAGQSAGVNSVAFSPDGRILASTGIDGGVMLWDTIGHNLLATLDGHTATVASLAFSPSGKTLASAGFDGRLILWDVSAHREIARFAGQKELATSVAFSPDGRTLAAGGTPAAAGDGEVLLWDLDRKEQIAAFSGPFGASVAFSRDGRTIASGGDDGQVSLLDTAAGTQSPLPTEDHDVVLSLAFSPDGRTLAAGSRGDSGGNVTLWDVNQRQKRDSPLSGGATVAFSPDGETLAFGGYDSQLHLLHLSAGARVELPGHSDRVWSVAFNPDGHTLATGGADGRVILWDTRDRFAPGTAVGGSGFGALTAFSPDRRKVASVKARRVSVWDMAAGKTAAVLPEDIKASGLGFADDETIAVILADQRTIVFWDLMKGSRVGTVDSGALVRAAGSTSDRRTLATASADGALRLWDLTTYRQAGALEGAGLVNGMAFSEDGRLLATASDERGLLLWDVRARVQLRALAGQTRDLFDLAFSPDGRLLATASIGGDQIRLWDVRRGTQVASLAADGVDELEFSPDGRLLAATGFPELFLFDVARRTQLGTLADRAGLSAIAFTADSRSLLAASLEGITSYDLDVTSWRSHLCRLLGRELTREEHDRYLPDQPRRPLCP